MEDFYVQNKREVILAAYQSIEVAIANGDVTSEEFGNEISHICERYNIEMIILDADSKTVRSSSSNSELLGKILWENMISPTSGNIMEPRTILEKGETYTLQLDIEKTTGRRYLDMWGIVGNGNLVLLRATMESIRDNVTISNTFMIYVGIIAVSVGSVIILYICKRITDPIKQLYLVSDEMKKLNNEIDGVKKWLR